MSAQRPETTQNALTGAASVIERYGFQRSLDDELGLLIGRYGVAAVREASRRLTKGKRGRKPEKDWVELKDSLHQDALDWLDGRDPMALRSNYSLASEFTKRHPGQSAASTHRRIMKKLSARRKIMFVVRAWWLSETDRPYEQYFRAAVALAECDPAWGRSVSMSADRLRGTLERYRAAFGEPDPAMSIKEIDDRMNQATNALMSAAPSPLLGFFGR